MEAWQKKQEEQDAGEHLTPDMRLPQRFEEFEDPEAAPLPADQAQEWRDVPGGDEEPATPRAEDQGGADGPDDAMEAQNDSAHNGPVDMDTDARALTGKRIQDDGGALLLRAKPDSRIPGRGDGGALF